MISVFFFITFFVILPKGNSAHFPMNFDASTQWAMHHIAKSHDHKRWVDTIRFVENETKRERNRIEITIDLYTLAKIRIECAPFVRWFAFVLLSSAQLGSFSLCTFNKNCSTIYTHTKKETDEERSSYT